MVFKFLKGQVKNGMKLVDVLFLPHQQKISQATCLLLSQSLLLKYLLSCTIGGLQEGCKPSKQEDAVGTHGMSKVTKLTSKADGFLSRNLTVSKFMGIWYFYSAL